MPFLYRGNQRLLDCLALVGLEEQNHPLLVRHRRSLRDYTRQSAVKRWVPGCMNMGQWNCMILQKNQRTHRFSPQYSHSLEPPFSQATNYIFCGPHRSHHNCWKLKESQRPIWTAFTGQLLYKGHCEKKSLVVPKNKTPVLTPEVAPKCSHVRQVYCRVSVGKYDMSFIFIHTTMQ